MKFHLCPHELNVESALIYMWEIRDGDDLVGRYVGKAKGGSKRPLKHYKRNVANILLGKPYRKGKPDGYRSIHLALAEAERRGYDVTLHFLCNVNPGENINQIEQKCILEQESRGPASWQLNG